MQKIKYLLLAGGILLVFGAPGTVGANERPKTLAEHPHYTFYDYQTTYDFVRTEYNYSLTEVMQDYSTGINSAHDASYPEMQNRADVDAGR